MKFFKIVLGLISCIFSTALNAQTTATTSPGIWTDASVWSAGIPGTGTITANVNHSLEINSDISIGTTGTGVYNISGSMTDFPGGTEYALFVGGNGTLDVQSGTTFFGGVAAAMTSNGARITVRSGATLILTGPAGTSFANGTVVLIEAGGTLIVNGDFTNNITGDQGSFTVEGTVQINGKYSSNGDVDVLGNGQFFTTGEIETIGNSGTVFGSSNNCGGPCSGQNLCFPENSPNNLSSSNQYLCSGDSAVPLVGAAIAGATYQWQSSITSAISGFQDITGATGKDYNPGTPSQTTWYRRRATSGSCSGASSALVIAIIPAFSWMGNFGTDWHDGNNWCGGLVPTSADDVVLVEGLVFYPTVGATAECANLTISSGATLAVNASQQINVNGNLTNNGLATINGTINFNGASAQTIGGTGFATYDGVIVNNTSGATPALTIPSNGLSITTQLTLAAGKVNLSNANLTIGSSAGGILDHTGGWIYNGSITRWLTGALNEGNDNGLFPLGSSTDYRPMSFGNTNISTVGTIRVSHTAVTGSSSVVFDDNGVPVQVRSNSFWTVAAGNGLNAGTNNFSIRTEGTGFGTVSDVNHLRLTQVGTAAFGIPGANAGSLTNPQVNRTAIPLANLNNDFYWGSIDATSSPLPVELISFTAALKFDIVELKWSTASEFNNDHFTIERSVNLEDFEVVATIRGNGTTKIIHHYNTLDPNPAYGRSYYRLKQTDFDGKSAYSDVKVIDYEGPKFAALKAYPNPLSGTKLTIVISGLKDQATVPVVIYNVQGQLVFEQTFSVDTPGTFKQEIELPDRLTSGLYIIKAGPTLQLMQKLVVD
ncbi:MAG TPA: T9SS type A sorting domain-containing protein [Chryseolinea sp.]